MAPLFLFSRRVPKPAGRTNKGKDGAYTSQAMKLFDEAIANIASGYVDIFADVPVQLGHERLTEAHDLVV